MYKILIALLLLVLSNIPLKGHLLPVESEFMIDIGVIYRQVPGNQGSPCAAFDGTNYFVAWSDARNDSFNIYGTRIAKDCKVLDPGGIPICIDPGRQFPYSIAFDGSYYFIVWHSYEFEKNFKGIYGDILRELNRDFELSDLTIEGVYGIRVDMNGELIDPSSIPISVGSNSACVPSVAFDGKNYLVVWRDHRNNNWDIYGTRVNREGIILDTQGLAISTKPIAEGYPSIAFDGTNYLVVWEDNWGESISGARVAKTGTVLDPDGISICNVSGRYPAVAFDGANYLVAWESYDIYGTRVDTSGNVLDPSGIAISDAQERQERVCLTFGETSYFVAWTDWRNKPPSGWWSPDIYGARVTPAGEVVDIEGIPCIVTDNYQGNSSITFGGENHLVVWEDARMGLFEEDVYGALVDTEGYVSDTLGIPFSIIANEQRQPSVIFDGTNYFSVWEDYRHESWDIYGIQIGNDFLSIAISTDQDDQFSPSIAFDGVNCFIVWEDYRSGTADIYGSFVSLSSEVLNPEGIPIAIGEAEQRNPCVDFDGINYFVIWENWCNDTSDIYGTRVSQYGNILDSLPVCVTNAARNQVNPSLTFDGTNYFVLWEDWRLGYYSDILGTKIDTSGNVLNPWGIAISCATDNQSSPSIAYDRTNRYFAVWEDWRNAFPDIYGARLAKSGEVIDTAGIAITFDVEHQKYPAAVFDGMNWLVVWQEKLTDSWDIYGTCVSQGGDVVDKFGISTTANSQLYPALISEGDGRSIIVYQGYTKNLYNSFRIWATYSEIRIEENTECASLKCYPNPAYNAVYIDVMLPWTCEIDIRVYDIAGRFVKTIARGFYEKGSYKFLWNIANAKDRKLCSGIYFLLAYFGNRRITEKILVINK